MTATRELDSLQRIATEKSLDGYRVTFSRNGAKAILEIAAEVLTGELAAKHGNYDQAIARLHRGILLEDNLIYNEPPDWHVPVRQSQGAVLLEAGRAAEAEAVYWQDLSRNRENGWSLYGLMLSLRAQGKEEQAFVIEKRFRKAWNRADVTLPGTVNRMNVEHRTSNIERPILMALRFIYFKTSEPQNTEPQPCDEPIGRELTNDSPRRARGLSLSKAAESNFEGLDSLCSVFF